jgi:hypothetical protein
VVQTADGRKDDRSRSWDAPRLWWYGLGSSLLGLLVGVVAGLSVSPIVAILVPLLFALLSGGGGLYIATADLSKPDARLRINMLGKILFAFCSLALVGTFYGALVRTAVPLSALVPTISARGTNDVTTDFTGLKPEEVLELSALRLRLQLLGSSSHQIDQAVRAALKELKQGIAAEELIRLSEEISTAAAKARSLVPENSLSELEANPREGLLRLLVALHTIEWRFRRLASLTKRSNPSEFTRVEDAAIRRDLEGLREWIRIDRYAWPSPEWQSRSRTLRETVGELAMILESPSLSPRQLAWRNEGALATSVDRLWKDAPKVVGGGAGGSVIDLSKQFILHHHAPNF